MPRRICSRPRWPPPPSVEDEVDSLARELDGLSQLGKKPDAEGVIFKGTVDQYPILIPLGVSSCTHSAKVSQDDVSFDPTALGLESSYSSDHASLSTSSIASSRRPTLAERLEEKLRRRRALRELQASGQDTDSSLVAAAKSLAVTSSDTLMVGPAKPIVLPRMSLNMRLPKSAPQSPTVRPRYSMETNDGGSSRSTGRSTPLARLTSECNTPKAQSPSRPPKEVHRISTQTDTKRTVTFTDQPTTKLLPFPSESSLTPYPLTNQAPTHDIWSTLQGLTHLTVCPSCTTQISASKFHTYLIPIQIPATQKPVCSFTNPWTRLAWTQTITQNHDHLGLLYQITHPPPDLPSCPGRIPTMQFWYKLPDPDPERGVDICTACFWNLCVLLPRFGNTFMTCSMLRSAVCAVAGDDGRLEELIVFLESSAEIGLVRRGRWW